MHWRGPTNRGCTMLPTTATTKTNTDAQTDYPHGYIYIGNNSLCCPSPLPFSPPQVLLQFPLEKGGGFLGEGPECPRLCPHLPQPPPPPSQALCGGSLCPPSSSPVGQVTALHCEGPREPWRIPQMERGNRRQRPRLCGATKSPRVTERNMGGKERDGEKRDKERLRERVRRRESEREREEGGEGGACLRRVACWSAKSVFVRRMRSLLLFEVKYVQVWCFLQTFLYMLEAIFIT